MLIVSKNFLSLFFSQKGENEKLNIVLKINVYVNERT